MRGSRKRPGEADALGLLGLARKAGSVVTGVRATRAALERGELELVLVARDAAPGQLEKVLGLLRHRSTPARHVSGKAALGAALGEGPLSLAGVRSRSFAEQLLVRLPEGSEGEHRRQESGEDEGR